MPGLPKGAFLKNPEKRPDSIGGLNGVVPINGVHSGVFMIRVDFPFGEEWWTTKGRGQKKGPPKRNTGLWRALYAAQFKVILEIGACCGA